MVSVTGVTTGVSSVCWPIIHGAAAATGSRSVASALPGTCGTGSPAATSKGAAGTSTTAGGGAGGTSSIRAGRGSSDTTTAPVSRSPRAGRPRRGRTRTRRWVRGPAAGTPARAAGSGAGSMIGDGVGWGTPAGPAAPQGQSRGDRSSGETGDGFGVLGGQGRRSACRAALSSAATESRPACKLAERACSAARVSTGIPAGWLESSAMRARREPKFGLRCRDRRHLSPRSESSSASSSGGGLVGGSGDLVAEGSQFLRSVPGGCPVRLGGPGRSWGWGPGQGCPVQRGERRAWRPGLSARACSAFARAVSLAAGSVAATYWALVASNWERTTAVSA